MSDKKKGLLDRFEGTVFDAYRKTGEIRYLYAFMLQVSAISIIAAAMSFTFYDFFTTGSYTGGASKKLILMVGVSSLLLGLADLLSFQFKAVLPKLLLGSCVLYFMFY